MPQSVARSDLRVQRGARARADILRAAERIFATSGLEGARTEAIAEAAKVNKALLFYHFKNKDALFRAVVEDLIGVVHRRAVSLLSRPAPPAEILLQYVDLFFDAISSQPDLSFLLQRALLTDSKLGERIARKYFIPRLRRLADLIERGVKHGDFRQVDALQTAVSVNSLIVFSFLGARVMKDVPGIDPLNKSNLKRRKQAVLDFIRHGLFRDPGGSPA